jgi:hypothetical protein
MPNDPPATRTIPWVFVLELEAAMFTGPAYEPPSAITLESDESSRARTVSVHRPGFVGVAATDANSEAAGQRAG